MNIGGDKTPECGWDYLVREYEERKEKVLNWVLRNINMKSLVMLMKLISWDHDDRNLVNMSWIVRDLR